jgi:hypothetical protein
LSESAADPLVRGDDLQPAGHRADRDERARREYQQEHHRHAGGLGGLGIAERLGAGFGENELTEFGRVLDRLRGNVSGDVHGFG